MKNIKFALCKQLCIILIIISLFTQCKNHIDKDYSPTTQEFIAMVEADQDFKVLLEKAINKAKEINPNKETNPAQTLEEYYDFIEWSTKAMPWNILKQPNGSSLYNQIDQSLAYFYFINDIPLEELEGKGYYNNSLQYHEPYRTWLIQYSKEWGRFLETPESWTQEYYQIALNDPQFGLQKGWYENPDNWKSFNDFFARRLKSPDMRPIAEPDNDKIVVSAADAQPNGVWAIDEKSDIVQKEGVLIKSKIFNSIKSLIGNGSAYTDSFAGGTLTHSFLDVFDYHRYHFPVSGTIKEVRTIAADDAAGGIITWSPERNKYLFFYETPGWQTIETRGCIILETKEYGLIALLPIGMGQVCSVNFEENIKVGASVKKGDMLGYFLFGGSDFVILFQKGVDFTLTAEQNDNKAYKHLLMGEQLGVLSK